MMNHLLERIVHHLSIHRRMAQLDLPDDLCVDSLHCLVPRQLVQLVISEYRLRKCKIEYHFYEKGSDSYL